MSGPDVTVAQLQYKFEGTPFGASVDYAFAQNHDARLQAVEKAVNFACNELEKHKHKKQKLGEDAITLEICSMLRMGGFQADHDSDIGGHCDIVVKGSDLFLWLAEAKEHSSYSWLGKGFKQLTTRYSTGAYGQDHAEVLIYCYSKNAEKMLSKWKDELEATNSGLKTEPSACGNPLVFRSTHKHGATGLDFHVRHKAIALYWQPEDR